MLLDDQVEALKFARERIQNGAKYICHQISLFYLQNPNIIHEDYILSEIYRFGLCERCTSFTTFVSVISGVEVPFGYIPILQQARLRWLDEMIEKRKITRAAPHAGWAISESRGPYGWRKTYDGSVPAKGPYDV
ncbi:hypothetical protein CPT_Maja_090 [Burkholderia phage Maja]|uniref:Uncharacterized protein n=1 Tax=Burkholderia phage Maja TaxID=2767571 RepID=A0A7S6R7B5_9CAUD|nr:hypothetical protein CPT_Maja_090 [Burkholderia phage Maja]